MRQIPHLAGYYVSSEGNVWKKLKGNPRYQSRNKVVHRFHENCWYAFMVPSLYGKKKNYLSLHFKRNGKTLTNAKIHRLVLLTFSPCNASDLLHVNHINRNTFDNRVKNLEWVTPKENIEHYWATSLPKPYDQLRAEYLERLDLFMKSSDLHVPMEMGSWQIKYDTEAILHELANSPDSMEEIAQRLNVSFRAVKYWQEKCKVKRPKPPTLLEQVNELLLNHVYTPNELADRIGVRVTSIHAVLRKRNKLLAA